jgi:hypothetical protein
MVPVRRDCGKLWRDARLELDDGQARTRYISTRATLKIEKHLDLGRVSHRRNI